MQIPIILLAVVIASCVAQSWKQLPGSAKCVSAKGEELWMTNQKEEIFCWKGDHWKRVRGRAVRVGASPDGWTWGVNEKDEVYRYNVVRKDWDRMPGSLKQVSAMSKDRALGVNRLDDIFLWEKDTWIQLKGKASWCSIGDGDERWVINSDGKIFRWNHSRNNWDQKDGSAVNIDVQSPCRVIATNAENKIFIWKNNNWEPVTGGATSCTINYKNYCCVNKRDEIWFGK